MAAWLSPRSSKDWKRGSFMRLKWVEISFPDFTDFAPRSWAASLSSIAPDWENVLPVFFFFE